MCLRRAGDVTFDWDGMMKQKESAVTGLTKGIEGLFKKNKVSYTKGWGTIKGANEVEVAGVDGTKSVLNTKNILIATGSEVTPLPNVPIDEERWVRGRRPLLQCSMKEATARLPVASAPVFACGACRNCNRGSMAGFDSFHFHFIVSRKG